MTSKEFYEQEHGTSQFLSKATIIALLEKRETYLRMQKPNDDSHLRHTPEVVPKKNRLSVYFNNSF